MQISIIIPTKNRREDLLVTLRSIIQQSRPPEEVVIIDQSQESCKEEILKLFEDSSSKSGLIYIWDKDIKGPVPARALGFKKSSGEIVFFLDDDITLERDAVENLLCTYDTNPVLGGIGAVSTDMAGKNLLGLIAKSLFSCGPFSFKKNGWFFTAWIPHYFHNRLTTPYPSRWLFGGIMSFKRNVVEEIGFDSQLTGHVFMGDIDFTFRASERYNLVIDPRVKGFHRGGMVALYNVRGDYEKRVSGNWYFFGKHIKKNPLNNLFFVWSLFGSLLVALAMSLRYGSLDPLQGFLNGMRKGAAQYRKFFRRPFCKKNL